MGVGADYDLGEGRMRAVRSHAIAFGIMNAIFEEWQEWNAKANVSPLNWLHTTLDIVGFIPGIGDFFDAVNGVIYLAEGDTQNAAISFAAASAPFAGDLAKLTRGGKLLTKGLSRAADGIHASVGINRKLLSRSFSAGFSGTSGALAGGAITYGINGSFWDGTFVGGLGGAMRGFVNPYICFVAGTQVVTGVEEIDGEQSDSVACSSEFAEGGTTTMTRSRVRYLTKRIEDMAVGDLVLAKPEDNPDAEPGLCRVAEVYRRTSDHLRVLTIRDSEGREQSLKTTDDHPFFIDHTVTGESGWVNACKLTEGDQLQQPDGGHATVIVTEREEHPDGIAVFNFQVEETHTYFVRAEHAAGEPIWVHNASYGKSNSKLVRLSEPLSAADKKLRKTNFSRLRAERREMKLPRAGSIDDVSTVALLSMGRRKFVGVNAKLQNPRMDITFAINGQSRKHGEAMATQLAITSGKVGSTKRAHLFVDRSLCGQCGYPGNQARAMAKALGVDELIVHVPGFKPGLFTPS